MERQTECRWCAEAIPADRDDGFCSDKCRDEMHAEMREFDRDREETDRRYRRSVERDIIRSIPGGRWWE